MKGGNRDTWLGQDVRLGTESAAGPNGIEGKYGKSVKEGKRKVWLNYREAEVLHVVGGCIVWAILV